MKLDFFHRKLRGDIQRLDDHAGTIVAAIVKLADNNDNVPELAKVSSELYQFMLGSDTEKKMQRSLYSLDEYMDLRLDQCAGKPVNEAYVQQLREELLEH